MSVPAEQFGTAPERENSGGTEPAQGQGEVSQRDEAEVRLAPPAGKSREEALAELERNEGTGLAPPENEEDHESRASRQFSLAELFWAMTFASIGMAGARWFPARSFAALLGVLTLVSLIVIELDVTFSPRVRRAWLLLLIAYVASMLVGML